MNAAPILLAALSALALSACGGEPAPPPEAEVAAPPAPITELQKIDIRVAPGEGISQGQQAVVHYTGWLYEPGAAENKGKKFDSSRDRGQPLRFVLGESRVIKGWEEGVQGMRVGSQRRLIIPADLGYGAAGAGNGIIPPNATLLFDVELLGIEEADG